MRRTWLRGNKPPPGCTTACHTPALQAVLYREAMLRGYLQDITDAAVSSGGANSTCRRVFRYHMASWSRRCVHHTSTPATSHGRDGQHPRLDLQCFHLPHLYLRPSITYPIPLPVLLLLQFHYPIPHFKVGISATI